tara:strand:- start:3516 stop:4226 length:711 start_codon:yes stop_codon:yes gene_type:complete
MEKRLYYTLLSLLVITIAALIVIAAPDNGHDASQVDFSQPFTISNNLGIGGPPNERLYVERTDTGAVASFIGTKHSEDDDSTRVRIRDSDGGKVDWFLSANDDGSFAVHQGGERDHLSISQDGTTTIETLKINTDKKSPSAFFAISSYSDGVIRMNPGPSSSIFINRETGHKKNLDIWNGQTTPVLRIDGVGGNMILGAEATIGNLHSRTFEINSQGKARAQLMLHIPGNVQYMMG